MASDTNELKIGIEEPAAWSRRLSITVPAERVGRTRRAIASGYAQRVRLPGFRKGKTPASLVEKKFGPAIEQETLDRLIQDTYREALDREGLIPISQGKIDNVEYSAGSDLRFDVEFDVRPTLELGRVSGFTARRPPTEVGEDEVDSVIERLRDDTAVWHPLEDAAPDYGDQVTVEITILDPDGEPAEGEHPRTYRFAIGEGQAIPMVEESILTLKPGEEGKFHVRFPDDFPDEMRRGQEQYLQIRLVDARRKELAAVDDEFARSVGEFDSLEALRTRILEDLRSDAERRAEADVRRQLIEQLLEANPIAVPESLIDRYLDHITRRDADEEKKRKLSPEEEERVAQLRERLRPEAEWSLKRMMIVDHLAEREGLNATQDEIDARVEELAAKAERSASEVWLQLEKSGQLEALEREITEDKVFRYLESQNTVA